MPFREKIVKSMRQEFTDGLTKLADTLKYKKVLVRHQAEGNMVVFCLVKER